MYAGFFFCITYSKYYLYYVLNRLHCKHQDSRSMAELSALKNYMSKFEFSSDL